MVSIPPVVRYAPINLKHLGSSFRYIREARAFKRMGGTISVTAPILSDYRAASGEASGHYFHQDLLVARLIHEAAPRRHADIGSRVDGFVAHVAAFREIEMVDIRPMAIPAHPAIRCTQADLMNPQPEMEGLYDSVSCLHALEHFGLGRYGDPISPEGHWQGLAAISRLVAPGGMLYLSVPIGARRVEFNAHRVFDPADIPEAATDFELARFDFVDDRGDLHTDKAIGDAQGLRYGCGIYSLRKATA